MGQIIIGSNPSTGPIPFVAPLIETQANWGDGWQATANYQFVELKVNASSMEPSSFTFNYFYGNTVKQVGDTGYHQYGPLDLSGTWVRVSFIGSDGTPSVQFVGIVDSQGRELMGSDSNPSGKQTWVAVDPLRTLQKMMISTAVFYDSDADTYSTVGWVPSMNKRDQRGMIVGNVSDADDDGDYYYGGTSPAGSGAAKWTRTQYANYLITNFIQQTDSDDNPIGPVWTLAGQTAVTDGMSDTIDFPQADSAAAMLKRIIDPKYGIDWNVQYVPADRNGDGEGFQINIFAMTNQVATFGSATMPTNPNTVSINRTTQIDLTKSYLVQSDAKKVDLVKVLGKRIVVCGTLYGAAAVGGSADNDNPTLVSKWSNALESDYITAGGTATAANPDAADAARKREKYRDVYQHLGAPADWDLDGGIWSISTAYDGTLRTDDYQTLVRSTLHWIPLRQGFDYTANPPTDNTDGAVEPETSAPLAWMYDAQSIILAAPGYVQCEHNGIGVGVMHNDWGVFLHAAPNHKLAFNAWTQAQQQTTAADEAFEFDYNQAIATIAIESDHRLAIAYETPSVLAAGDGSVMVIEDHESELWCVLPGTVIDCDPTGNLLTIAPNNDDDGFSLNNNSDKPVILRNDVDRLSLIMAGVISRYINERARAVVTFKTFQPWAPMVGYILDVYQQGDDVKQIGSVITSITWRISQEGPEMVLTAGYVQGKQ